MFEGDDDEIAVEMATALGQGTATRTDAISADVQRLEQSTARVDPAVHFSEDIEAAAADALAGAGGKASSESRAKRKKAARGKRARDREYRLLEVWRQSQMKEYRKTFFMGLFLSLLGFALFVCSMTFYGKGDTDRGGAFLAVAFICGLPGGYQTITMLKIFNDPRRNRYPPPAF